MKVESIQNTSFQAKTPKPRYITPLMRAGIESLLIRMNHSIVTQKINDHFISTIVTKLKHENGYIFEDERLLTKALPHNKQMNGFSVLKFGKTRLDIDNENGEIIDFKKPFFKPWYFILKKAENVINEFRNNFYNSAVSIETAERSELTPEGQKKVKQFVLQTEKERLQQVTEQLERELSDESK